MKINDIDKRPFMLLFIALCLLLPVCLKAQTQVTAPMSSTPTAGEYYSFGTITLSPGFSFTATTGQSLHLYIMGAANCQPLGSVPSANQNYIMTSVAKQPGFVPSATNLSTCDVMQSVQYFDGLGRPLQIVQVKGSPLGKDLVQPVVYDQFGRETVKYLPYAASSADGSYKANAIADQLGFYHPAGTANTQTQLPGGIAHIPTPFAVTTFEASPLNRVLEQGAPGDVWQPGSTRSTTAGRTVVTEYAMADSLDVPYLRLTATGAIANTFYPSGKLYKTITKDENWTSGKANTVEEYKDFDGRVVMKKVWQSNTVNLMTFYVYDDFGNLRYVVPPFPGAPSIVTLNESDAVFKKYCYAYHYDGRNRLIEKRIPGKEWEYIVYNKLDQVVLTQNPKQRSENKWVFNKYDGLGRTIMTGLLINASSRATLQTTVDAQTGNLWETWDNNAATYTAQVFPKTFNYYHQVFFYDKYRYPMPQLYGIAAGASKKTRGLLTQTATFVMASASYMLGVNYYDDYGRLIKNYNQHYASSAVDSLNYDETNNAYNFTGELTSSTRVHYKRGAASTTIAMVYEYDSWGRKVRTREKINADDQVLLSENLYNEVGGLKQKNLHNGLQTTAFTYNPRGWLKSKTSNEFSELLKHEDGTNKQYNGNISDQNWGFASTTPNIFTYTYDGLNRLTNAAATNLNEAVTYDSMGNIVTMTRNGVLGTYTNSGNQLTQITGFDANPYVYAYDSTGNMTSDGRNKTTIAYNMLNLPLTVSKTGLTINYLYSANGSKLEKKSTATGTAVTTHYANGIQYTGSNIDFIQTEEGLARRNGTSYSYEYNLTDHLGNVRLTFNQNPSTGALAVLQKDDYFAFGKRSAVQAGSNKYLYNGKELQEELENYDYGARFYDPVIARWTSVDPLAEINRRWSPYNYVLNNPIRFIDPDGMDWKDPNDKKIADRLQGGISSRLKTENSNLKSANNRVAKLESKIAKDGSSKSLEKSLASAKADVSSISLSISDLNNSSSELTQMETTTKQTFTFNELPTGSEVGGTEKGKNGIITMAITSDANAIHEATHGFQIFSKGAITQSGRFDAEVSAYQRQYSFDSGSVIGQAPSDWGSIRGRSDITPNWVSGLHDSNFNYIYMQGFKQEDIKQLFKEIRKTTPKNP
jgi:RHS repeat-associated protein